MLEQRPRVLISSFACGPNWGSEIGMGWNCVSNIARDCDIEVITEAGFREDILDALPRLRIPKVPTFHFIDIGATGRRRFWNQGDWRFYRDYRRWQQSAYELSIRLIAERSFDLCHHLNMIGYREPGYFWQLPLPFVWGPVGGHEQMPWRFIPALGFKSLPYEIARNFLNGIQMRLSGRVRKAARSAVAVIAATPTNQVALRRFHGVESTMICETGTPLNGMFERPQTFDGRRPLRVSWCAKLVGRKALPIALRALALASREASVQLNIIGDGPDRSIVNRLSNRLGTGQHCHWYGAVTHDDALRLIAQSDCMILTSVQEATSTVVMEALSAGVPVICHDTCGFGAIVDRTCGLKIPLVNPSRSVRAFADALVRLSRNPGLLADLSRGAMVRARDFTWEKKAEAIVQIYRSVMDRQSQIKADVVV